MSRTESTFLPVQVKDADGAIRELTNGLSRDQDVHVKDIGWGKFVYSTDGYNFAHRNGAIFGKIVRDVYPTRRLVCIEVLYAQ